MHEKLNKINILSFNESVQNLVELTFKNIGNNLTQFDRIQVIFTTIYQNHNQVEVLLQEWIMNCNDKIKN